jgi:hypothetical protein
MNYTNLWEKGIIVMDLNYLNSSEAFQGVLAIRLPGSPNVTTENFDQSGRNNTNNTFPNGTLSNNPINNTAADPNASNQPASRLLIHRITQS